MIVEERAVVGPVTEKMITVVIRAQIFEFVLLGELALVEVVVVELDEATRVDPVAVRTRKLNEPQVVELI